MMKKPKVGDLIIYIEHFCDGDKDCIKEGEIGDIYNIDDYPDLVYADFTNHLGVAISEYELEHNTRVLQLG